MEDTFLHFFVLDFFRVKFSVGIWKWPCGQLQNKSFRRLLFMQLNNSVSKSELSFHISKVLLVSLSRGVRMRVEESFQQQFLFTFRLLALKSNPHSF